MRERVDATCELGAHAPFSIPEALEMGELEGAQGAASTGRKETEERRERKREMMRKLAVERKTEKGRKRERKGTA